MKSVLLVMFLGASLVSFSQSDTTTYGYVNDTLIQTEIRPAYPGGINVWKRFLNQNQSLPGWVEQQNITGIVTVAFTVNLDGKTSNYEIIKSVDPSLDKEAIRLVKKSGRWVPAINLGKWVIYRNRIDIKFPLENAN